MHFYTQTNTFTHKHLTHKPVHTQTLFHTEAFYTQTLLHRHTHTPFCTQTLLHTDLLAHRQTLLHTNPFTCRHFDTETFCHTEAAIHGRYLYLHRNNRLHSNTFAHRSFYTHTPIHTRTFLHTDPPPHRQKHSYTNPFTHKHVDTKTL